MADGFAPFYGSDNDGGAPWRDPEAFCRHIDYGFEDVGHADTVAKLQTPEISPEQIPASLLSEFRLTAYVLHTHKFNQFARHEVKDKSASPELTPIFVT